MTTGALPGTIQRQNTPMHSHIQGLFLLLIVGIALLTAARFAAPVVQEAFGENGALVAKSSEVDDTATGPGDFDDPLTGDEILAIQGYLSLLGFNPGAVDGLHGPKTAAAIDAAIAEYQLAANAGDRDVLEYLRALVDSLDAAATAGELPEE